MAGRILGKKTRGPVGGLSRRLPESWEMIDEEWPGPGRRTPA